jgi:DNA (cytosine-5)-methyltransferase 1
MASPKVVSLYSGAGGLDYGFERAGFRLAVATDIDPDSCATLRRSRPVLPVIEADITRVSTDRLLGAAGVTPGDDSVLIGGPPCQPFSKSAWWAKGDSLRLADPRAATLREYLRVLHDMRPAAFLLENVEGLGYRGKSEGLDLVLRAIEDINAARGTAYRPTVLTISAASFGVPQMRTRVLVIGARDGTVFGAPEPTHGDGPGLRPWHTAWDAIGDLGPGGEDVALRGKWAELLPSIPEGENYLFHTDRGGGLPLFGWRRRYWSFLLKLAKDRPAWTVQAQPGPATGPFHWENRQLTTRELCRLQTFPDDVAIVGGRGSAVRQVGNAVPSLLAEVVARAMLSQLYGADVDPRPSLLPPRRRPVPPPTPIVEVPARYRHLAGRHAAHPGTGKGPMHDRLDAVR